MSAGIALLLIPVAVVCMVIGFFLRRRYRQRAKVSPLVELMSQEDLKRYNRLAWIQPTAWAVAGLSFSYITYAVGRPWFDIVGVLFGTLVMTGISRSNCLDLVELHLAVSKGVMGHRRLVALVRDYIETDKKKKWQPRKYEITAERSSGGTRLVLNFPGGNFFIKPGRFTDINRMLLALCVAFDLEVHGVKIASGGFGSQITLVERTSRKS